MTPRPPGADASAGQPRERLVAELDSMLAETDAELASRYPGERPGRQPVHTCYLPADAFEPDLAAQWGSRAIAELERSAPDAGSFADAMGLPRELAAQVRGRVLAKLAAEPVEDLRLDFEDGYGERGDVAEDRDADQAAARLAAAVSAGTAPPFTGLRCKSLEHATRRRGVQTVDIFLAALAGAGGVPGGFVLTLPKVSSASQVSAMCLLCERLEHVHGLSPGRLAFEVQVETPQIVLGADGAATVARCIQAGGDRLSGLHYGTYDYSASVGIAGRYQSMAHPAADHARAVMQVAAAGTGIRLSDGSSNVLPEGSVQQVSAAWGLHARLVRRSLERGYYQGWDMHPAQLVSRYAATYAFFLEGLDQACGRLRGYRNRASSAGVLDEPATARALAGYLIRGLDCGALGEQEVASRSGLGRAALETLCRATWPAGSAR